MSAVLKTATTVRVMDTITVRSAELGVRIAKSGTQSPASNAEYSHAVVQDGKSLSKYIIEKHTGRTSETPRTGASPKGDFTTKGD